MSANGKRVHRPEPYVCGKDCPPQPGDEVVGEYSRERLMEWRRRGCGRSPSDSTRTAGRRTATGRRARPRWRRSRRVGAGSERRGQAVRRLDSEQFRSAPRTNAGHRGRLYPQRYAVVFLHLDFCMLTTRTIENEYRRNPFDLWDGEDSHS